VVVVVSEETGAISIAVEGVMESRVDPAELPRRLAELLGATGRRGEPRGGVLDGVRRLSVRGKA
jgi:hypothetical protein